MRKISFKSRDKTSVFLFLKNEIIKKVPAGTGTVHSKKLEEHFVPAGRGQIAIVASWASLNENLAAEES